MPKSARTARRPKYWELAPGDLILTGTPGGVGAVNRGETVNAGVSGAGAVRFKLV